MTIRDLTSAAPNPSPSSAPRITTHPISQYATRPQPTTNRPATGYVECHDADAWEVGCKRLQRFVEESAEGRYFSSYDCGKLLETEPREAALLVATCLEKAARFEDAKGCWGERPLGQ